MGQRVKRGAGGGAGGGSWWRNATNGVSLLTDVSHPIYRITLFWLCGIFSSPLSRSTTCSSNFATMSCYTPVAVLEMLSVYPF